MVDAAVKNDWLTVEEISRTLRVGKVTLYKMLRSGAIPSRRFGKSIRIPAAWLDAQACAVSVSNEGAGR